VDEQQPTLTRPKPKRGWRRSIIYAALIIVTLIVNYSLAHRSTEVHRVQVPYSPFFVAQVRAGNVEQITSRVTAIQGEFRKALVPPSGGEAVRNFKTEIPAFADNQGLSRLLESKGVVINAEPLDTGASWWQSLLFGFGPTIVFILLMVFLFRRFGRAQSMLGSFGRSRARRYQPGGSRVTFADVAGIDEAKAELTEIVDFLRNPAKYRRLGGRIPRGVLLSGPPGTGKTLLARAVAGEANAPFFSMSASEFIEAIVGVGASRVRDLFKEAKEAAPAIIFIDELDAIGRSRSAGGGLGGGNDEREQTLNQILTEMDGFDSSTSVIVIGATNRPDVLDQALLRPGRFDRRVAVQPPDRNGRRLILEVHARSVPLDPSVDLDRIAATTPGMVGADLANLVNEAALLAARRNRDAVAPVDFADALERIILGAARKIMMSDADRRRTAYHEAGHAVVGMLTPGADPVRKVSIIPRGPALGVTFSAPDADRFNYTAEDLLGKIKVALGGRAAEEVTFGDATTGAEGDIDQLTRLARYMVGRWGMSPEVGMIAVLPSDGASPFASVDGFSQRTRELLDAEVRRIVDGAYREVVALLRSERGRLDALAEALLARETLDEDDAYAAANVERSATPV
jgi:cell division protease FtsH